MKVSFYNGLSFLGNVVMVAGSVLQLKDTLNQKEDLDNGDYSSSNEVNWTPVYVIASGLVVSILANNSITKHPEFKYSHHPWRSNQKADFWYDR